MKFSVLLPTRNRLDLLHYAVQSVLRQNYAEWELVISDNCSEENVEVYIQSLNDSRVKYHRTSTFVPVTDNWNNALAHASGDYVIMLGDDDCLMPGYFSTLADLIKAYKQPSFIFTDAYLFGYPGVLPDYLSGYLRCGYNTFFESKQPFVLDPLMAIEIVRKSLALISTVNFNMQLSLLRRDFIHSLADKGAFFQSPFPDYYATVVAFLKSQCTVIYQQPMVTIGISPKSYGFYHFNKQQQGGKSFLYNSVPEQKLGNLQRVLLPGNWEYTGWLAAMEAVKSNYQGELEQHRLSVDYNRYRRLQIIYNYKNYYVDHLISDSEFAEVKRLMREWERLAYGPGLRLLSGLLRLLNKDNRKAIISLLRQLGGQPNYLFRGEQRHVSDYQNILDVFERVPPHHT